MKPTPQKRQSSPKKDAPRAGGRSFQGKTYTAKITGNSVIAQRTRLLSRLKQGPVSTIEARNSLDIIAPAPRIFELRRQGHSILTLRVRQETSDGRFHSVACYVLQSKRRAA